MRRRYQFATTTLFVSAFCWLAFPTSEFGAASLPKSLAAETAAHHNSLLWVEPEEDEPEAAPVAERVVSACEPACVYTTCADRWWFSADYLLFWTNGNPVPPLVTTNPTVPPREQAGVLGVGDTEIVVGGRLDEGARSGVALSGGYWLDDCQCSSLQLTWWYAGDPADEFDTGLSSTGVPVLARPFFNVATGLEDSQLVAYPQVVAGTVEVLTGSDLQSAEALLSTNWMMGSRGRIDLLGGYRYFRFREGVLVEESLVSTDPGGPIAIGTTIDLFDSFNTSNSFHGGELGLAANLQRGFMEFDAVTKLGIGNVRQRVVVDGLTVVTTPNGMQSVSAGGLLALPSNMGRDEHDAFGLLPELNLRAKLNLTDHLSANVGYTLLFLTNVYRAGNQIDRMVDPGFLPHEMPINGSGGSSGVHPVVPLDRSTLCVQGLNVGFTVTY